MDEKSEKKQKSVELQQQTKPLKNKITDDEGNTGDIDWKTRKKIFSLFLYVVIFTNFDTGVIPACINQIEAEMDIGNLGIAALGSLPFFAISIASLMVPYLIKRYSSKKTLAISLMANIVVILLFSVTYNLACLYIARFMMGFTQAFWVIYAPVWTNHSSPLKQQSTWLGLLQGFSPLGIILGYIATGIVVENWSASYAWRFVIVLQAICEVPIFLMLLFVKNEDIDIFENKPSSGSGETLDNEANQQLEEDELGQSSNLWKHSKILLTNGVFVWTMLTVTVAFFVVFGVQFWSTSYIIKVFGVDGTSALIIYAVLSISSPVAGVFFGGYLSDKMGGYKGSNLINSLKLCMAFSIVSVFVGIPSGFVYKVYFWAPLIWAQIFFGACNIPGATGVVVNSVPKEYQTSASGFAQIAYNMLAYFASPLFSGGIMDLFSDSTEGMLWGYRANEFVSFLGILFTALSLYCVNKEMKKAKNTGKTDIATFKVNPGGYRQRAWSII